MPRAYKPRVIPDVHAEAMLYGRIKVLAEGKTPGGPLPYGYRKVHGGHVIIDPLEGPVVHKLFLEARNPRMSLRNLRWMLEEITARTWTKAAIRYIIRNPYYTGKCGEMQSKHPPLVSTQVWNAANKSLAGRAKKKPAL